MIRSIRTMAGLMRFDGRVALITGAGGGLGKEYALLLASRGAKIVVNDLGGTMDGSGRGNKLADDVVSIIRSRGGEAVANYDSVEDGDKVVKTAIDNFGRVDILINNAGILRDRSLAKMTDQDWDLVYRVHLRGAFMVTRAAFPYMKKQNYGRIVMTSSPSGLYGNFGQANYSAAKLGLVGFANTVSKEGAKYNVFCNTVAPTAWSRMTQNLMPPEFETLIPVKDIAPIVAYLCHDSFDENGIIIETFGGWVTKIRVEQGRGVALQQPHTMEDVRENWSSICDMTNARYPTSNNDYMLEVLPDIKATHGAPDAGSSADSIIGATVKSPPFSFNHRDIILYALGVGCTISQTDTSNLKYLYEGHPEFSAIPSYAVIPAQASMNGTLSGGIPGIKEFNLAQALHGEQYVELKRPFPTEGTLYTESRIADVVDKKSGALIILDAETKNERGELIAVNQFSVFIIGAGGFGGKTKSDVLKTIVKPPSRPPDASLRSPTLPSQAALYRLNGDYNPLHIDADFAKLGGFQTPILHGLCSYGIATRHIMRQYCGDDVAMVKAIKARFSKPVLPGQTIQTDMWKEGNRIHFICKIVETGQECLSGGYLDLNPGTGSTARSAGTQQTGGTGGLKSAAMFSQLKGHVAANPDIVKKVKAIFQWNITKDGETAAKWTLDLKNAPGSVYEGPPKGDKPGCTLTLSDDDFMGFVSGSLNPQKAFASGRLKLGGNIMLSQKLSSVFTGNMARLKTGGGGGGELKSVAIFKGMKDHIAANPDVVKKVKAIYQWNITKDGETAARWTLDLKNAPGSVYEGPPKGDKPGCTLTLSDDDFVGFVSGSLNPQKAFASGRLKLGGNIMLSQKLSSVFPSNKPKL